MAIHILGPRSPPPHQFCFCSPQPLLPMSQCAHDIVCKPKRQEVRWLHSHVSFSFSQAAVVPSPHAGWVRQGGSWQQRCTGHGVQVRGPCAGGGTGSYVSIPRIWVKSVVVVVHTRIHHSTHAPHGWTWGGMLNQAKVVCCLPYPYSQQLARHGKVTV
jgi:hypothetical protein